MLNIMFRWLFGRKKEVERIKEETKTSFDSVKNDINRVSTWIKHLDNRDSTHENNILEIKEELSTIKTELEGIKNIIPFLNLEKSKQLFKQQTAVYGNQTAVYGVQTPVYTAVQTANFSKFSTTERAIVWILLNSDMKLSYDDLAAILGRDRSTIRGQINRIKQRSENLIQEVIEKNGKKRLFIPEESKNKLLKVVKREKKAANVVKTAKIAKKQVSEG